MNNNEELIVEIIENEWEMFHKTSNYGGVAPCQEDRKTFNINRFAQAASWSKTTLESYLRDIMEAKKNSRNLMAEKYARMMKSTWPEEYKKIEYLLPPLDQDISSLVEKIIMIVLGWEEELQDKYPNIIKQGRPLYSSEDTRNVTSLETYLRGELSTYSLKTLNLYFENVFSLQSEKINGSEVTLEYMMKSYGFKSANEANEKLR